MSRKLKPERSWFFLTALVTVVGILVYRLFVGESTLQIILLILMSAAALANCAILVQTGNLIYLAPTLFYILGSLTFLSVLTRRTGPTPYLAAGAMVMFALLMWALFTGRLRWYYRAILEAAAEPVDEAGDGFTPRPFPAGYSGHSRGEIDGFARFLAKNIIAFPYFEEKRVVLLVPENIMKHFLHLKGDYDDESYVSFWYDGSVTVNIAEKDYKRYREELTFDRLCDSFGGLFGSFIDLFLEGKGERIIERLKGY